MRTVLFLLGLCIGILATSLAWLVVGDAVGQPKAEKAEIAKPVTFDIDSRTTAQAPPYAVGQWVRITGQIKATSYYALDEVHRTHFEFHDPKVEVAK